MTLPPLARYLPILNWGRRYDPGKFTGDMVAAVIVTIMLIPRSLAYALLAGMPPEAGIYASITPIVLYAIFGTSRALAVGPVAVVSLMTAAALSAGVITSIVVHLYKTSRPHMAVVGRVPGTEHFRNVRRHEVETQPHVLSLRVDESLYFPNARFLEDQLLRFAADKPQLTDVILMFPAVNEIDLSALDSLEAINTRLDHAGIRLHLSEVKGPVMDRLKRSRFLDALTGEVYLSQHEAAISLAPENGQYAEATGARDAL